MASDLSSYKVTSGEVGSSSKFDNYVQAVQDALNAIGDTSKMAFAAGKIIDPTQIKQSGATNGQALVWNGTDWAPATVGGGGGGDALMTHDEFTTDKSVTATTEGTANTIVVTTSKSYVSTTPVKVEFFAPRVEVGGTAGTFFVVNFVLLRDSAVLVGKWSNASYQLAGTTPPPYGDDQVFPIVLGFRDTSAKGLTTGAHTYTVKAYVSSASGNATVKASAGGSGALAPGYLRVFQDL